jgi:hypothetical protein
MVSPRRENRKPAERETEALTEELCTGKLRRDPWPGVRVSTLRWRKMAMATGKSKNGLVIRERQHMNRGWPAKLDASRTDQTKKK